MKNLPAVREFVVPEFTSKERAPMLKASLAGYTNLVVYSVLLLMAGIVVGLEQGRKPLIKEMQEREQQASAQAKADALKAAITQFKPPATFQDFRIVEAGQMIEVHFGTAGLFGRGQAVLGQESEKAVSELAAAVLPAAKNAHVQIEAYTDDSPMQEGSWQYPTNWELSGARAARFLRVFKKAGFENLTFVGYGEQHPLLPNRDAKGMGIQDNRLKNRRVVIRFSAL